MPPAPVPNSPARPPHPIGGLPRAGSKFVWRGIKLANTQVLFNSLALKVSPQRPQRAFFCSEGAKKKKKPKYRFGFPMALYFFFEKLNFSY